MAIALSSIWMVTFDHPYMPTSGSLSVLTIFPTPCVKCITVVFQKLVVIALYFANFTRKSAKLVGNLAAADRHFHYLNIACEGELRWYMANGEHK